MHEVHGIGYLTDEDTTARENCIAPDAFNTIGKRRAQR